MYIEEIKDILDSLNIKYTDFCTNITKIDGFCNLDNVKPNSITWVKVINEKTLDVIKENTSTLFFVSCEYCWKEFVNVIAVPNLKSSFFMCIKKIFRNEDFENKKSCVESSATVLSSNIQEGVYIGHGSFVDTNVVIGRNVTILNNVVIQGKVIIGDNTFIESGAVIGVCGYGLYENEGSSYILPHLGRVIIGNNVRIGASTCIARGCLCDTIIEDDVKIDNLCHIAHNVVLKKNCKVVACCEISGGVIVGENTWVGPNTSVKEHVQIGRNSLVGLSSNILKNMPDDTIIYGNPAKIKENK